MSANERPFVHYICNSSEDGASGIQRVQPLTEVDSSAGAVGEYPANWIDNWHELEGGSDLYGIMPQYGVTLCRLR